MYSPIAATLPGSHEIKSPVGKSPQRELHDEITLPVAIPLSCYFSEIYITFTGSNNCTELVDLHQTCSNLRCIALPF